MHLRPATKADASSIAALSIEVWIGTYLRHGVNAFFADFVLAEFTAAKIAERIANPNETIMLSENEEGIDGFVAILRGATKPLAACSDTEITTLYVQPRHHGKGVGKALLSCAIDTCQTAGVTDIWLATNAQNAPAIAFYLAQGFTHIGHKEFVIDDQAYLNYVYTYRIT